MRDFFSRKERFFEEKNDFEFKEKKQEVAKKKKNIEKNHTDKKEKDFVGLFLRSIGLMSRVFTNSPGFNPRSNHAKDSKNGTWYRLTYHSAL